MIPIFQIMAGGALLLIIGGIVSYLLSTTLAGAVPVDLEVVKVHNDDSNHTYFLEFEVLSGTHRGERCQSGFRSSTSPHKLGEHVKGYYNPETQEIESSTTIKLARRLSTGLLLSGGVVLAAGLAYSILS